MSDYLHAEVIVDMIPYPERRRPVSTVYADKFGPCIPRITEEIRAKILTMDPELHRCKVRDMDILIRALGIPKAAMKGHTRIEKKDILEALATAKAFGGLFSIFSPYTREGQKARKKAREERIQAGKDKDKAYADAIFEAGRQSVLREYGLV